MITYGKHHIIKEKDIETVVEMIRSDQLTFPLHPGMTEKQIDSSAKTLDAILKNCK